MKKTIAILLIALIVFTGVVYFFVPSTDKFTYTTETECTNGAFERFIVNKERWIKWWPGQKKTSNIYSYKNYDYRITKVLLNGFEATIYNDNDSVKGNFHFMPGNGNSVVMKWESILINPANPFLKISSYMQHSKVKANIRSLLSDAKRFFDDEKNIYGFTASVQKVTDEFLINVKQPMDHYPSMKEVYDVISEIKNHISKNGGIEKSPPMLNVYNESPGVYQLMVAIPTTSKVPEEGKFLYREMVMGNILIAEVKGGDYAIRKAQEEMNNYLVDYRKTSPALPYQSLITNRIIETDTAKWVTKLYYPVFY